MNCAVCSSPLSGAQTKFCSNACKHKTTNNKHQNYEAQQIRGLERKAALINLHGGECADCSYKKNLGALHFHHLRPEEKKFQLCLRSLSNRSWKSLLGEAAKCVLLCGNCHAERHYPHLSVGLVGIEPTTERL